MKAVSPTPTRAPSCVHPPGCLKLTRDGQEDGFEEGDAVYFQANVLHGYECVSQTAAKP